MKNLICQYLKQDKTVKDIPVIMLTAKGEEEDKIKGLESGVDDYLTKVDDFKIQRGLYDEDYKFVLGKSITLKKGKDIAILATGTMVKEALNAYETLKSNNNINVTVVNFHTIKPLDVNSIIKLATEHKIILTIEEHSIIEGI